MAILNATACGEEPTNETGDVTTDIEVLRIIYTDTLHTETETANTGKYHRMAVPEFLFQNILKLRHDTNDRTFRETTVTTRLFGYFFKCHFTLAHSLCKIFSIRAAALDIVLN